MIARLLFWLPFSALVYSYILYPLIIRLLAASGRSNITLFTERDELPPVTVIMAVHNEQEVLEEKINSINAGGLPSGKLKIIIGSDASTDNTNMILNDLAKQYDCLRFQFYEERRGKPAIINELAGLSDTSILIITDANVIFDKDAIFHLVKHFKNNEIGLVDSGLRHRNIRRDGISLVKNAYITGEKKIKNYEGIIWGTMMGPSGGCYALRKELYSNVPDLFLVDDFYINMMVITSGHKSIIEPAAVVWEDIPSGPGEEFRRMTRIATGNFQNFKFFFNELFSGIPGLAISFLSHKILRWLGPFFLVSVFLSSFWLGGESGFYRYALVLQLSLVFMSFIDYLLGKIKIHIIILRCITHFVSMNFALLFGFIKFLKGVKTNVWEPTRREQ
jgi:cellulose synthase/poly-beta-1,6-N-acetylglucosamine synthase-like glycosyltransferase